VREAAIACLHALVAVLAELEQCRGGTLSTTWARRFATLEVPGEIRRRRGHVAASCETG
jgi:hypothetical protein